MIKRFLLASLSVSVGAMLVGLASPGASALETVKPNASSVNAPPNASLQDGVPRIAMQVSVEKEALVREYLAVTRSGELAVQMIEPMIPMFQQAYPSVPPAFFETMMAEMSGGGLVDLLVPVFAKHLTTQELEAAIAFYRTPEGQSLLQKTPLLMQESQQVGAVWGEQLGEQILRELESQGYLESRASWSEI